MGQLAGTYALENDIRVGRLLRPLRQGWFYTDPATGRKYTDHAKFTAENWQSVNPYDLPVDRPAPVSAKDALKQHFAAKEISDSSPDKESVAYSVVAERLEITQPLGVCSMSEFDFRADLSPILDHYGPGIYTLSMWATTLPDGGVNQVAAYPIWWESEPTPGHPYTLGL